MPTRLAKWSGVALLACYGYAAGRVSGSGQAGALIQALAVGLIGAALIGIKALLH